MMSRGPVHMQQHCVNKWLAYDWDCLAASGLALQAQAVHNCEIFVIWPLAARHTRYELMPWGVTGLQMLWKMWGIL